MLQYTRIKNKETIKMGLFNGYLKEGKGVEKNEKKKRGFFLYIDILWQKMSKLIAANCLYSLTSLPWLVLLYFFFGIVLINTGVTASVTQTIMSAMPDGDAAAIAGNVTVQLQIFLSVSVFVLWGSGPSSAAYAYVNRCFTRSEPVWVVSDGWDKFKENFKQSMVVLLIDAAFLFFAIYSVSFYRNLYITQGNIIWLVLEYFIIIASVIFTMMHSFIYQIMVTFDCSIGAIYKNALIITLAKLPGSVLTTAISAAFLFLVFIIINLNPLFAALIVLVFGLCFTSYVTDFYAARVIEKNVLKNMKAKKAKEPVIEYLDEEDAAE